MTPFELMMPSIVASAVVAAIALNAVRQARREEAAHKAEFERRMAAQKADHEAYMASLGAPLPPRPTELNVRLDLDDSDAVPDVREATQTYAPFVTHVDALESELGGRGLAVTGFRAVPGEVEFTFTPRERADAADRLHRVAERINAADPGFTLPPGVAAAWAREVFV